MLDEKLAYTRVPVSPIGIYPGKGQASDSLVFFLSTYSAIRPKNGPDVPRPSHNSQTLGALGA